MPKTRVFFITDVHGSDRCFRKFVNAGKFYDANVLILGGDITGKVIVPLVSQPDGTQKCAYAGKEYVLRSNAEVDQALKNIRDMGHYPCQVDPKEAEEISANPTLMEALFKRLMKESLAGWMKLAEERLKGTGISCYISPGNDDFFEIDEVLNSSPFVINPEQRVVDIGGGHEMITLGYTNHTPWNSPREVDEDVLEGMIEKMASQLKNMSTAVFNIHVPPINTPIDKAPKLNKNLTPVLSGGEPVMESVGSTAVRRAIEKHQPLIGIHGHIHESRGAVTIGRTLCLNPGSEYSFGTLRGALFELENGKVKSYILTSG